MITQHTVPQIRHQVASWRAAGERVAFVPTMGALHAGHLSLVTLARQHADRVVASIFINPRQFAAGEDLDSYPRDLDRDRDMLERGGCDLLFAPNRQDIYPDGFQSEIHVGGPAQGLESDARPHFFTGVATVVVKLLNIVAPDCALFGEKDYQQLLVVRRVVQDLDLPIDILGGAIIREADGLAFSSRNAYLNAAARRHAAAFPRILHETRDALAQGADVAQSLHAARDALIAQGFTAVDYIALCDAHDLSALSCLDRPARLLGAVHLDGVRLIDNLSVMPEES